MKKIIVCLLAILLGGAAEAQTWPEATREAKAGTRWWWLGSAVDHENLRWSLDEYARAGIGAVEITPLYGVEGNEKNEISFLSPQWMQALRDVEEIAAKDGIEVDMNNGTGWPFGGPEVPIDEAACKVVFVDTLLHAKSVDVSQLDLPAPEKERKYAHLQCVKAFNAGPDTWRVIAVYASRTRQQVKRAAPGGEGYVIDHFDREAVRHYLDRFEKAFAESGTPYPHTFFNDSYEVYGANWTPSLFQEFKARRGYALEDHLPELLGYVDDGNRVLSDYRETLSDLLYENFTQQWVAWAHSHGVEVRNQAHGSPANLLDLYALVDIPEIEGFGLSEFGIKGLRTDSGFTRKNFSDVSMLKYAPSAAHVMGKRYTSSETFTWLTEHFRTSLSQMKPDLDLMFTCGVNHVFFHGSCYSPKDDPWPGWRFYASIDMTPNNSIWRDAPYLMKYIERCQSFLQWGQPDNDFLVYLPVRDMWAKRHSEGEKGLLMQFDIHAMDQKAPEFISSILRIDSLGYDCDYISDRQLAKVTVRDGRLVTEGGTRYKGLIIPTGTTLTAELKALLAKMSNLVVYGEDEQQLSRLAKAEPMKSQLGLRAIRRTNATGHHYFIANLTPKDVDTMVPIVAPARRAYWLNPLNGDIRVAETDDNQVRIHLRSGESMILQTFTEGEEISSMMMKPVSTCLHQAPPRAEEVIDLTYRPWTLTFTEETPQVNQSYNLKQLQTWETLGDAARIIMGTGVYTTTVKLNKKQAVKRWLIDLGDVRESARVYVNGQLVGCAWSVPFTLECSGVFHQGKNEIRIEVTNLPANRIAELDRQGVKWRKMKEINVVDLNYKRTTYEGWEPVKSGLASTVKLVELLEPVFRPKP
ncbi:MAG: glycosyl hydrolase family 2 [Prevotella sp.]|nr:glycosyl hydrolase family 2 [Prevotella sp.]